MAAKFDNIDDVNSKFLGTICYYEKMPVLIKASMPSNEEPGGFALNVTNPGGRNKFVQLNDPLFDYKNFNIGYANQGPVAVWWYRKPLRQYHQGLKKSQMGFKLAIGDYGMEEQFNYSKPYINMLKNVYPELPQCEMWLKTDHLKSVAFHKDFAVSWDEIHKDFILEYRGKKVGNSIGANLKDYKLVDNADYLKEALHGALFDVHR